MAVYQIGTSISHEMGFVDFQPAEYQMHGMAFVAPTTIGPGNVLKEPPE